LNFIGLYSFPEEPFFSQSFVLHLDGVFSHWQINGSSGVIPSGSSSTYT
jgi:hypothetical protein